MPLSTKKKNRNNPWISRETLRLQRKLKRVKKQFKIENKQSVKQKIDDISSQLKSQVYADKQRYYGESLPSFITTAPEKFWRSISPTSQECDLFHVDGKAVHESKEIANAFNKHFKSVYTNDNDVIPPFEMCVPPIPDVQISEPGILNMLLQLNTKKSSGPDNIPNTFLKRYAEWTSKYLHILFTRSLCEGQVPSDWRTARVKPIHKTGKSTAFKTTVQFL